MLITHNHDSHRSHEYIMMWSIMHVAKTRKLNCRMMMNADTATNNNTECASEFGIAFGVCTICMPSIYRLGRVYLPSMLSPSLYICARTGAQVHVCMYVWVQVCVHNINTYITACIHIHMHVHIHVYMNTYITLHGCMYVYMCTHACVCV